MHAYQPFHRCPWMQTIVVSLALVMLLSSSVIAQPKDVPAKDKAAAEITKAIVGKFGDDAMAIVIELIDGKYQGTITRGGKTFPFTGELKGPQLVGQIDIGGAKSGFSATVEDDDLVLTLGLDSQKLPRIITVPPGDPLRNTIRKEVLLASSDEVQLGSEIASPDNQRIGFIIQRDGFRHAVVNGAQGKAYRRTGDMEFSPDSKRHSYIAETVAGKRHVVVDEVEGDAFNSLMQGDSRFSPDSKRVAYAGLRGNKWHAVIDGKQSDAYDAVIYITFSPDSKRVAFAGRRGKAWHVVIDGVEGQTVDDVGREGFMFSPDSKRLAYTAIEGSNQYAVVDGVRGKPCEGIAGFAFSPDSLRTYYIALRSGQYVFIAGTEEKGSYESVHSLNFSADSKQTVFGVRKDGKFFYVINDRPETAFEAIAPPTFSHDNQQIVYPAKLNAKWTLIRDGKSGKFHDQIPSMAFSPDSQRLAYVAIDGDQSRVVIDDAMSARYASIWRNSLHFSPDSKHLVLGGRRGEDTFLVVNAIEDKPIGSFIPGSQPVFDAADRFHVITKRGSNYYRLDVHIINPG